MVLAIGMLPLQSVQAGMIGADQLISSAASQADRTTVSNFLNRAETAAQLQSLGLDANTAKSRVASMTDEEVASLAGKINALPAGASGLGELLVVILIVWLVWHFVLRR
jgi:hypothetical protein